MPLATMTPRRSVLQTRQTRQVVPAMLVQQLKNRGVDDIRLEVTTKQNWDRAEAGQVLHKSP